MGDTIIKHYHYSNNVLIDLFESIAKYFYNIGYLDMQYYTISTYDKGIEQIRHEIESGKFQESNVLPSFILDPTNIELSDPEGKLFTNIPRLTFLPHRIHMKLYTDINVMVTAGFNFIKGSIEITFFVRSIYEYLDVKLLLLQLFGGYGRPFEDIECNSFIILPDSIYAYEYEKLDGTTYTLDWSNTEVAQVMIKSLGQTFNVYPISFNPTLRLESISDGSSRQGGTDSIAEYKVVASLSYETPVPLFLVLQTDLLAENVNITFSASQDILDGLKSSKMVFSRLSGYQESNLPDEQSGIEDPDDPEIISKEVIFRKSYAIKVGEDSPQSFSVELDGDYAFIDVYLNDNPVDNDSYTFENAIFTYLKSEDLQADDIFIINCYHEREITTQ